MNNFIKNTLQTNYSATLTTTVYSYMRDGTQTCAGFHIPYVTYLDEYGVTQTFYADECSDICGTFTGSSIISENYVTAC